MNELDPAVRDRMNKLRDRVRERDRETQSALRTVYKALNWRQRKKLMKDETVKKLFECCRVETEDKA